MSLKYTTFNKKRGDPDWTEHDEKMYQLFAARESQYDIQQTRQQTREEIRKEFCSDWIQKPNPNPKYRDNCRKEVCDKFKENKTVHPISKRTLILGEPAYNNLLEYCDIGIIKRPIKYKRDEEIKLEEIIKPESYLDYALSSKSIYGANIKEVTSTHEIGNIIAYLYLYEKHKNFCFPYRRDDLVKKSMDIGLVYIYGTYLKRKQALIKTLLKNKDLNISREKLLKIKNKAFEGVKQDEAERDFKFEEFDTLHYFKENLMEITAIDNAQWTKLTYQDIFNFENLNLRYDYEGLENNVMELSSLNEKWRKKKIEDIKEIFDVEFTTPNELKLLSTIMEMPNKNSFFLKNDKLIENIKMCLAKSKKRFMIIDLLIIAADNSSHANVLLYDTKLKTLERFEPASSFNREYDDIDSNIWRYFRDNNIPIKEYLDPYLFCPKVGLQTKAEEELAERYEPVGYCLAWTWMYIEFRLSNPDVAINLLVQQISDYITARQLEEKDTNFIQASVGYFKSLLVKGRVEEYKTTFKSLIRDYANFMSKMIYTVNRELEKTKIEGMYAADVLTYGDITKIVKRLYF